MTLPKNTRHPHLTSNDPFLFKLGNNSKETDTIIWRAFKNGNPQAFDYIFETYLPTLCAYGNNITKDQGAVDDCIQDLFIELWNKKNILSDTDSIKYYLLKSLRRKIVRRLSVDKRYAGQPLHQDDDHAGIEFSAEFKIINEQTDQEQQLHLQQALNELSKRQREAIYLKFYQRLSYDEIASILNLNIKSAYNLIGKAIDSLRKSIKTSAF
jgi:RNA polymerase sigma factor (sigma-70 family)